MHTPLRAKRSDRPSRTTASAPTRARLLLALLLALLGSSPAWAQLTGPKAIPGDYSSLSAAITDLNAQGVGTGGVTFNVAAGHTETAVNLTITAAGTAANPVVFQKAGSGANPLVTAGVGTSTSTTPDAIIRLVGADYVTFDGIDVAESSANATTVTQMEFGYALFRASATDGCQNNTIRNCVVTLNKTNTGTIGIAGLSFTTASTTAVPATSTAGANSGNKVYANVVTNTLKGIDFAAGSATATANYDQNNEIGVTAGNTIGNFGGTASGWGAGGAYQNGLKISGNTINSTLNYTSATASSPVAASTVTSTLRGIYCNSATSASVDITNNTVTLASGATSSLLSGIENSAGSTAANNTVNITGNTVSNMTYATATSASTYGVYNTASAATVNLTGNTVTNNAIGGSAATSATFNAVYNSGAATTVNIANNVVTNNALAGTSSMYLVYGGAPATVTITGNQVTGNSKTGGTNTSGSMYCLAATTAAVTATNNTVSNNSITTAGTSSSTIYGYHDASSPTSETVTGNTFTNLSIGGTTTSTSSAVYGIYSNPVAATVKNWSLNTVAGLSLSIGGSAYGIYSVTGGTVDIFRNKVYDLSAGAASGAAYGLYISSGTTVTASNNLIGDLRTPAATGVNAISGVYVGGGTNVNLYYNSLYINATSSSATTFGSSGLYVASSTPVVDARNNVWVNLSTPGATGGATAAFRYTATPTATNYAPASNNNLYYAGTPAANRVIYVEGTATLANAKQTIADYKGYIAPRDQSAVSENPPFLSTNGADATFLHISPGVATQIESGGQAISGISVDFDGDTRGTTPDIGADEGSFTPQDLSGPSIAYTALANTASTANRTLDVTITDPSGVATGANAPRLYYRKGSTGAFAFVNATSVNGSVYTFTFDFAAIGGVAGFDVIQYYVAAQDNSPGQNVSSTPVGGSGTNPPGTAFSGTPNQFFIQGALSGTYYVGTGTSPDPARTYPSLTAAVAAYSNNNLGGAVTFALIDAAYSATTGETFPVVINAHADASATNTLTIKPHTGVTASITGSASAVLQLLGADYVTVDGSNNGTASRDLTLTSANTGSSAVVWVGSLGDAAGATNITLKNLNVVGGSVTSTTSFGIYAAGTTLSTSGTGSDNDNLVVQNNAISTAYEAIYARGTTAGLLDGLQVTRNEIGGSTAATTVTFRGMEVAAATAPLLSQNRVAGMQTTGSISISAIELGANVANAVVSRNFISNLRSTSTSGYGAYGVLISSTTGTTGNEISNNMISDILTDGDGTSTIFNPFGIRLAGGTGTKVYYNSVNLTGAFTNTTTADISAALLVTTSSVTGLDLRNNVLANSITGGTGSKSYAVYLTSAASVGTFNHNDYYVSGANGVLAYVAGDKADLAALRAATTQDANSVSANPQFTSATDLHVTNSTDLSNAGTPVSVTVDFDGETRSTTLPDIGADEFVQPLTADLAPVALVSPAAGTSCFSAAEAVTVSIRAVGGANLDFAATPATITVVATAPGGTSQTLTTTLTSGTLASGGTQNVTLPGTVDMSAAGAYTFAVTATVQGDVNPANDVLATVTRTVTAPAAGTLAASAGTICVSGTTNLALTGSANGSIQLQQSTDNVTFTDISGATGTTYTTPVLTQTTYFRARTTCNASVATSNVVTVTVNNPQVTGTNSPVAICEGSTATLTATASAGATLRFFDQATGGTPLATGATFTTPALTASRQYFVEAVSGGSESVGRPAPAATTSTTASNYGLVFSATSAFTLTSVDVYPAGVAGNLVVQVQDNTGTLIPGLTATVAIPAGNGTTAFTVPLGFNVPAGTGMRLIAVSSPAMVRESSVGGFPYTSPSGAVSITNGYISGTSTTYYYFYNWQVSTECIGARTAIQVNVTPQATASLPAATATTCGTSAFQLSGTVGGSATGGTYTSSGTGTFSPNATTLNATYTPSAADVAAGTVTLTLTTTGPATCSAATAQVVLTISAAPVAAFSYPTGVSYCAGSALSVRPNLGTGATAGTFSSTTGLTLDPATGAITLATSVAGTYTVTNTVAASGACPAVTATATVTVAPAPARPTISVQYNGPVTTLTSSSATGNQWYLNGTAISGATGQTYVVNSAAQLGSYTVVVTNAQGCASVASAPLVITSSTKPLAGTSLQVYPNPTPDGRVTLELSGYRKAVDVTVVNALGQVVRHVTLPAGQMSTQLDMTSLPAGVYVLRTTTEGGTDTRRIVRQK